MHFGIILHLASLKEHQNPEFDVVLVRAELPEDRPFYMIEDEKQMVASISVWPDELNELVTKALDRMYGYIESLPTDDENHLAGKPRA